MPRPSRAPLVGLVAALAVVLLAATVPALTGWQVYALHATPLNGDWQPRVGAGTVPALVVAALASWRAVSVAETLPWRRLLLVSFGAALAWLLALALVDGTAGLGSVLQAPGEYLGTARHLDVPHALHEWVGRISIDAGSRRWPTHVAGHPPGATLFFWLLVRLGLGSALAAGLVVTTVAATTPVAVLLTLRRLGTEDAARRVAPFLVFGPAAVWSAVSADALFAATTAWGACALASAATSQSASRRVAWAVAAGLLLGSVVMFSYGLLLVALLALVVLWLTRTPRPTQVRVLAVTAGSTLVVVLAFAALGFDYWRGLPALKERYWAGVAGARPGLYWFWGNLAALTVSAGPVIGAGLGALLRRPRALLRDATTRVVAGLSLAGVAMVVAADASQMSRAEVERIWLPFVPWLLVSAALLPRRWRRWALVGQVVTALLVQHLLHTEW